MFEQELKMSTVINDHNTGNEGNNHIDLIFLNNNKITNKNKPIKSNYHKKDETENNKEIKTTLHIKTLVTKQI